MNLRNYIDLNDSQYKKFDKYMDLLIEWNKNINLTAITDKEEIVLKHFADSLSICKYFNNNDKVIDIGTGAGFPGIPLKIYNNTLNITLLDSLNKRVIFLNNVIDELELNTITAIHGRAEELGRNIEYREKYDKAVSRAVANLSTLLEYVMPFVKEGGEFICMKGPNIEEEIKNAKNALKELGGSIERIDNFKLGFS
jgi:16S rRNA (guanine527-N7)-methyltransferase